MTIPERRVTGGCLEAFCSDGAPRRLPNLSSSPPDIARLLDEGARRGTPACSAAAGWLVPPGSGPAQAFQQAQHPRLPVLDIAQPLVHLPHFFPETGFRLLRFIP